MCKHIFERGSWLEVTYDMRVRDNVNTNNEGRVVKRVKVGAVDEDIKSWPVRVRDELCGECLCVV